MYAVEHRPCADAWVPWSTVSVARTEAEARDELESWVGPSLRHGDMLRLRGAGRRRASLYVFDAGRGPVRVPAGASGLTEAAWEGDGAAADDMLKRCSGVALARVALAACECADYVSSVAPAANGAVTLTRAAAALMIEEGEREMPVGSLDLLDEARELADREGDEAGDGHEAACFAAYAASHCALVVIRAMNGEGKDAVAGAAESAAWYAAASASFAGERASWGEPGDAVRRSLSARVRRYVPLPVAACAVVGAADPLPVSMWARRTR